MKKNILIFGAHPDDCEIGMGGSIIKFTKCGHEVRVVDLTQGEMSSNGNIFLRQEESKQSGKILGLTERFNLKLQDRNIEVTKSNIEKAANIIRKYRPHMVFFPSDYDTHPDHLAASRLIKESIFHAKLKKFESKYDPIDVGNAYMYHINDVEKSDFYIDITNEMDKKMNALKAYESQFGSKTDHQTRLNSGFLKYIESRDYSMGYKCKVSYAEGFRTLQPLVIRETSTLEALLK